MIIELTEGVFLDPEKVMLVKVIDEKSCALFLEGANVIDGGITLDYPAEQVAGHVNDAIEEMYSESEPEETDDKVTEPEDE